MLRMNKIKNQQSIYIELNHMDSLFMARWSRHMEWFEAADLIVTAC